MEKNKYQKLTKEEKAHARARYYKTPTGSANKIRFTRLLICGILCLGYSLFLVIWTLIKKENFWNYILAGTMFIFGLIFLIGRGKIISRNVNNYLGKNK